MDLLDDDGLLDIRRRASKTDPGAVINELAADESRPARNSALTEWASNLGRDAPTADGRCHLCDQDGRYTCNQCHASACASDYWLMFGLCRRCAKDERVQRFHKELEPEDSNWLGDSP